MQIIKVGISYQTVSVEVREQMTFTDETAARAMKTLNERDSIRENVIFSTCNRTEVYAVVEEAQTGIATVEQFLTDWFQIDDTESTVYFTSTSGEDAMSHLFKLATGLDSMVIGETQILGQVKDAFSHARTAGVTGKILNELFKRVVTFAKRAHHETTVGEQAVSVSYVAVELAKKIFGSIDTQHVVIVGAGETGELSLKNLQGAGVSNITVMNRTFERAQSLAEKFHADTAPFEQMTDVFMNADIVISSTGSPEAVLTKDMLDNVAKKRKGPPLFLIDMAVPRDVDTEAEELDNVFLYDMDDLETIASENLASREKAAGKLEHQIRTELEAFYEWLEMQDAVPVIKALQEKSYSIQAKTFESIERKMPYLTERETKVLQKHTMSIANQLLEEPLQKVKTMGHSKDALAMFQDIFGLDIEDEKNNSIPCNTRPTDE